MCTVGSGLSHKRDVVQSENRISWTHGGAHCCIYTQPYSMSLCPYPIVVPTHAGSLEKNVSSKSDLRPDRLANFYGLILVRGPQNPNFPKSLQICSSDQLPRPTVCLLSKQTTQGNQPKSIEAATVWRTPSQSTWEELQTKIKGCQWSAKGPQRGWLIKPCVIHTFSFSNLLVPRF